MCVRRGTCLGQLTQPAGWVGGGSKVGRLSRSTQYTEPPIDGLVNDCNIPTRRTFPAPGRSAVATVHSDEAFGAVGQHWGEFGGNEEHVTEHESSGYYTLNDEGTAHCLLQWD
jgi:hypothetical protein